MAAGGAGLRILALEGAVPIEGGVPIVVGGKIVGAIGVSGGTSDQDGVLRPRRWRPCPEQLRERGVRRPVLARRSLS